MIAQPLLLRDFCAIGALVSAPPIFFSFPKRRTAQMAIHKFSPLMGTSI